MKYTREDVARAKTIALRALTTEAKKFEKAADEADRDRAAGDTMASSPELCATWRANARLLRLATVDVRNEAAS